eukprot:7216393-Pyramimonas_sp.AAC.1
MPRLNQRLPTRRPSCRSRGCCLNVYAAIGVVAIYSCSVLKSKCNDTVAVLMMGWQRLTTRHMSPQGPGRFLLTTNNLYTSLQPVLYIKGGAKRPVIEPAFYHNHPSCRSRGGVLVVYCHLRYTKRHNTAKSSSSYVGFGVLELHYAPVESGRCAVAGPPSPSRTAARSPAPSPLMPPVASTSPQCHLNVTSMSPQKYVGDL